MGRYDIAAIRNQVQKKLKKNFDPAEFRPPKVDDKTTAKFRFYILGPYSEGDRLISGPAQKGMDCFFVENGSHFLENKVIGCPRVIRQEDCEICQFAFDSIQEIKATSMSDDAKKESVKKVASKLLPPTYRAVNIYFPDGKLGECNPEDLRGKVMWFNTPVTIFNTWWDCLSRDDDGGDAADLKAYGVFFDELSAMVYQLEVYKKGRGNAYDRSKFLTTAPPHPIARTPDGAPDMDRIKVILNSRHNLFDKIQAVDHDVIKRIASNLASGDTSGGGFDKDEDSKDSKKSTASTKHEQIDPDDVGALFGNGSKLASESATTDDEYPVDDPKITTVVKETVVKDKPPAAKDTKEVKKPNVDDDEISALLASME